MNRSRLAKIRQWAKTAWRESAKADRAMYRRLLQDRVDRLVRLRELHAPKVILKQARALVRMARLGCVAPRLTAACTVFSSLRNHDRDRCKEVDGWAQCRLFTDHHGQCAFTKEDEDAWWSAEDEAIDAMTDTEETEETDT